MDGAKRRNLEKMLRLQYGIESRLPSTLVQSGERKIRIATPEAFVAAQSLRRVHSVGLYVAKIVEGIPVLSMEGTHLFCHDIRQNVVELSREQSEAWMSATPVELKIQTASKYVAARRGLDCLGCGRTAGAKVFPHVPRWRRITPPTKGGAQAVQRAADDEKDLI